MHLPTTLCFVLLSLFVIVTKSNAATDVRQRFEGLVGKTVQAAWIKIDREARGSPMEVMREGASQSNKPITPGYARVIISDRTGRVLYTPILQPI